MKVVHLNNFFNNEWGVPRAVYRLHSGLLSLGCDSIIFASSASRQNRTTNVPFVKLFQPSKSFYKRLRRFLYNVKITNDYRKYGPTNNIYDAFIDDRHQYGYEVTTQLPKCDILHLHRIVRFVDHGKLFKSLSKSLKVVWTLHDMNPFTGGCDYDNNCGRYIECCGSCPQLGSNQDKGLSFQIWQRKKKALSYVDSKQLHIVSPSKWLAEKATKSSLLNKFPISVIPNGIDTDVFFPTNQKEARQKLNLPLAAKIVLFIASSLTIVRKGGILLVESLNKLRDSNNLLVATVGQDELKIDKHIKTHHFGYIHDNDPLLSLIYSAADIFIAPSLQENFSNTVLESFACGTPVIGFDVGGMPDMVRKGVTGELAEINDVYSLCNAIAKLLKNDAIREDMSRNCRRIALTEYSLEVQAKKYIHLYESMLGTKSIGQ